MQWLPYVNLCDETIQSFNPFHHLLWTKLSMLLRCPPPTQELRRAIQIGAPEQSLNLSSQLPATHSILCESKPLACAPQRYHSCRMTIKATCGRHSACGCRLDPQSIPAFLISISPQNSILHHRWNSITTYSIPI